MYTNSSSSSIQCRAHTPIGDPSAVSLLYLLHLLTQLPVMRSKEGSSLPDHPNLVAMRERREQRKLSLSELKRGLAIEWHEHPQLESAEAYETPKLITRNKKSSTRGNNFPSLTGGKNWLLFGLPGAGATGVGGEKSSVKERFSVEEFLKKHTKDFEIWQSPSAENVLNMRGMIIVIGEHHYDPIIAALVKKLMYGFRRTRGDRFFMEGGIDLVCEERIKKYLMESDDCRLMEKNCAAFWELRELADTADQKLLDCVTYLRKNVPSAQEPLAAQNAFAYTEFMKRHSQKLPLHAISGYQALDAVAREAGVHLTKEGERLRPERDAHIVKGLLDQLTETGINYLIVGSDHLKNIREQIKHRRCVFMLPKLILKEEPSASLFASTKVEL
jgi:hypothetical protein